MLRSAFKSAAGYFLVMSFSTFTATVCYHRHIFFRTVVLFRGHRLGLMLRGGHLVPWVTDWFAQVQQGS